MTTLFALILAAAPNVAFEILPSRALAGVAASASAGR